MIYRAITDENFYYLDIKKVARVFNKFDSYEELKKNIIENQILEYSSERNFQIKMKVINRRLKVLNDFLLNTLATETSEVGKVVNLLSIILNEKIVFDFMYEVFLPKYKSSDYFISNCVANKWGKLDDELNLEIKQAKSIINKISGKEE